MQASYQSAVCQPCVERKRIAREQAEARRGEQRREKEERVARQREELRQREERREAEWLCLAEDARKTEEARRVRIAALDTERTVRGLAKGAARQAEAAKVKRQQAATRAALVQAHRDRLLGSHPAAHLRRAVGSLDKFIVP